jgi:guanine deaminase
MHTPFMRRAIELSRINIDNNGGPFGAIIVKNGQIVAEGANRVTASCDPTAHAEIVAIRAACTKLNTFNLTGCTIYTSCEPCPMCLAALYWARIDKIFYANTKEDAAAIGFDDAFIYHELSLPTDQRQLPSEQLLDPDRLEAFELWHNRTTKTHY